VKKYTEKICVIGLGYIGLPTAALLACRGYSVSGVDINSIAVDTINAGGVHIVEPDLEQYVDHAVSSGTLKAFLQPQMADIYIICVPTPFYAGKELPTPNLEYVISAIESITPLVKSGDVVILESTSPVGTTETLTEILLKSGVDIDNVAIAYCPERVLPGRIMLELISNDRIVGGMNVSSAKRVKEFYETFVEGDVLTCSANTAEMCKLAENSFRDVNIALANELSMICDTYKIDPWELIRLANHHPRVDILQPGAGVGGHCIAVDPWFIVSGDPNHAEIIKKARQVNDFKPKWIAKKVIDSVQGLILEGIKAPRIACLGLAFKPDIDDLRESPAAQIVKILVDLGLDISVVEPNIQSHEVFSLCSFQEALNTDLLVLLVKHKEFLITENQKKLLDVGALDFCGVLS
jgi:UDP-N-acetyl-D-mannosaminuronic acid dehydrogenase